MFVDASPFRPDYDYSYDGVMRSHEASLWRLGVDRVDIVLIPDISAETHGGALLPLLRIPARFTLPIPAGLWSDLESQGLLHVDAPVAVG